VASGQTHTPAKSTLWQVHLDPKFQGKQIQSVLDRHCEFPLCYPNWWGNPLSTYLLVHRQGVDINQEMFGAIARFDRQTDTLTLSDLGENLTMEPIYAPDTHNPDQGWIVTVVYSKRSLGV